MGFNSGFKGLSMSPSSLTVIYVRGCQLESNGRPLNSLRTRLRAALVYTYIEKGGRGGINYTFVTGKQ